MLLDILHQPNVHVCGTKLLKKKNKELGVSLSYQAAGKMEMVQSVK